MALQVNTYFYSTWNILYFLKKKRWTKKPSCLIKLNISFFFQPSENQIQTPPFCVQSRLILQLKSLFNHFCPFFDRHQSSPMWRLKGRLTVRLCQNFCWTRVQQGRPVDSPTAPISPIQIELVLMSCCGSDSLSIRTLGGETGNNSTSKRRTRGWATCWTSTADLRLESRAQL